jgi:hypothetical protein
MTSHLPAVQMVAGLALAYVAAQLVRRFLAADGTLWDRAAASVRGSATVAASYFDLVVQALPVVLSVAAELLSDPDLQARLQAVVPAGWWPAISIGLTLLVYVARQRTLGQ